MKPAPKGWPRISSCLQYNDAAKMIDWLCEAFGFDVALKVEGAGGRIEHSELDYGDARIMVGQADDKTPRRWGVLRASPQSLDGANTQMLQIYVDDVETHCARAEKAGAKIVEPIAMHDYGEDYWADKSYGALDPEGHLWWVAERVRG